jgi:hypothetical protein
MSLIAIILLAAGISAASLAGAAPCGTSRPEMARLTPPEHDAVRPRFSRDGSRLAYVRRSRKPISLDTIAPEAESSGSTGEGEEIWILEMKTGDAARRVGAADLLDAGLQGQEYTLHDLSFSPDGSRLAFSWYEGAGWGQVLISEPDGSLQALPSPRVSDPWEEGASFLVSTAQFVWDASGRSGVYVGWDDQCGSLYRVDVPAGAEAGPAPREIPLAGGCRPTVLETQGWWLVRSREEGFRQRLGVVDSRGRSVDSLSFPEAPPVFARWGRAGDDGRPPVMGWRRDPEREDLEIFVWQDGRVVSWGRESCAPDCPEPLLLAPEGIYFLTAPLDRGRLMRIDAPGKRGREVIPSGVTALRAMPSGSDLIAVMNDGRGSTGLWRIRSGSRPPDSGGRPGLSSPEGPPTSWRLLRRRTPGDSGSPAGPKRAADPGTGTPEEHTARQRAAP